MDDTVSRRAAIESLKEAFNPSITNFVKAKIAIENLPSAQQERTGRWIHGREIAREMIGDCVTAIFYEGWTCSECGCLVEKERKPLYKYCPNCGSYNGGARMEGDHEAD